MDRLVFYHHPQAENFSLRYSSASLADIRSRREQSDESTKLIGYPFETPVYVLYEGDTEIESAQERVSMVHETERDDAVWYACDGCGMLFDSRDDAEQHEADCDGEEPSYIQ